MPVPVPVNGTVKRIGPVSQWRWRPPNEKSLPEPAALEGFHDRGVKAFSGQVSVVSNNRDRAGAYPSRRLPGCCPELSTVCHLHNDLFEVRSLPELSAHVNHDFSEPAPGAKRVAASSPKGLGMDRIAAAFPCVCATHPPQADHPQSSVALRFEAATRPLVTYPLSRPGPTIEGPRGPGRDRRRPARRR
jgi:hypothetical protein